MPVRGLAVHPEGVTGQVDVEQLAGRGGPLEVRRAAQPWLGAPQFAELAARLFPIEFDLLDFLDGHKVEIAPGDFSAQDVPRGSVLRYFGFTDAQLDAILVHLEALAVAETRDGTVGLTATAVQMLASRPTASAPPR